jgi:Flp pilus assembly protein TadG
MATETAMTQNRKRQRGSVMVEMALVLPVMLLLILGGIDLDLMVTAKSSLNYVAGETARCMARNPGCTPAAFGTAEGASLGLKSAAITVTPLTANCPPPTGTPCTAQAQVTYIWSPISPFFRSATLTSTATAQQ